MSNLAPRTSSVEQRKYRRERIEGVQDYDKNFAQYIQNKGKRYKGPGNPEEL